MRETFDQVLDLSYKRSMAFFRGTSVAQHQWHITASSDTKRCDVWPDMQIFNQIYKIGIRDAESLCLILSGTTFSDLLSENAL